METQALVTEEEDDEPKQQQPRTFKKTISSVARRVSTFGRRASSKPSEINGGSDRNLTRDDSNGSSLTPTIGFSAEASIYSMNDDGAFDFSMVDDVLLSNKGSTLNQSKGILIDPSIRNILATPPKRMSLGTQGSQGGSNLTPEMLRNQELMRTTNSRASNLSTTSNFSTVTAAARRRPSRNSNLGTESKGGMIVMGKGLDNVHRRISRASNLGANESGRSGGMMVVGKNPAAELAQRTPRTSLIPVPVLDPSRRGSVNSVISDAVYFDETSARTPKISPPVAHRDRRRSGMPDAFAVPLEAVALEVVGPEIADAHAEVVKGDPKFEPYRDMLRAGASEVEVAEAMAFFGVNPMELFGRDILAEHGKTSWEETTPRRSSLVWIEKKIHADKKAEEERKAAAIKGTSSSKIHATFAEETVPIVKARKPSILPSPLTSLNRVSHSPVDPRMSSLGQPAGSKSPFTDRSPIATQIALSVAEDETETIAQQQQPSPRVEETVARLHQIMKADDKIKKHQLARKFSSASASSTPLSQDKDIAMVQQDDGESKDATTTTEETAAALAQYRLQQLQEAETFRRQEQERARVEEEKQAAEAFARYQSILKQQQEEGEADSKTNTEVKEEQPAEAERRQREADEAASVRRKQEEEEARGRKEEEERRKKEMEEEEEQRRRNAQKEEEDRREQEEARLKALENRIEMELAKAASPPSVLAALSSSQQPPTIPPTRQTETPPDPSVFADIQGSLLKKTKGGQWHIRHFALRGRELSWLKSDQKTLASLSLTSESSVRDVTVGLKKFMFEVTVLGHPPLMVSAAGATEKVEWVKAIQFAIDGTAPTRMSTARPASGAASGGGREGSLGGFKGSKKDLLTKQGSLSLLPKGKINAVKAAHADKIMMGLTKNLGGPASNAPIILKSQEANERLGEKLSKFQAAARPQVVCSSCAEVVYKMEEVTLKQGLILHRRCFVCAHCKRQLTLANFVQHQGKVYCQNHYNELFCSEDTIVVASPQAQQQLELPRPKLDSTGGSKTFDVGKPRPESNGGPVSAAGLAALLSKKGPFMLGGISGRGSGHSGGGSSSRQAGSNANSTAMTSTIDNSVALSKPVVPAGRRRAPSMHPNGTLARQLAASAEPQDRMVSDRTFKILIDPSNTSNVLWMHASSRFERDKWVDCLCNVIQALEMKRLLEEAQKRDMMSAYQCQMDLESFLERNETSYSGYCEKLSIKSHRNWKRRWFDLSELGGLRYAEDESKRAKHTMQLTARSVVLDAKDTRLSGPLALKT